MSKNLTPEWIPCRSVGPFRFREEIEALVHKLQLSVREPDPELEAKGAVDYRSPDRNLMIETVDRRIAAVHAYHSLLYQGRELLGSTPRKLKQLLAVFDWKEDNKISIDDMLLKSASLGAMFFIEEGLVASAILSPLD